MARISSRKTAAPHPWGRGAPGRRLADDAGLQATEEELPAGESETPHHHDPARQVHCILSGTVRVAPDGESLPPTRGETAEIPPGVPHRIANDTDQPVTLPVIPAPCARLDRRDLPPQASG